MNPIMRRKSSTGAGGLRESLRERFWEGFWRPQEVPQRLPRAPQEHQQSPMSAPGGSRSGLGETERAQTSSTRTNMSPRRPREARRRPPKRPGAQEAPRSPQEAINRTQNAKSLLAYEPTSHLAKLPTGVLGGGGRGGRSPLNNMSIPEK